MKSAFSKIILAEMLHTVSAYEASSSVWEGALALVAWSVSVLVSALVGSPLLQWVLVRSVRRLAVAVEDR